MPTSTHCRHHPDTLLFLPISATDVVTISAFSECANYSETVQNLLVLAIAVHKRAQSKQQRGYFYFNCTHTHTRFTLSHTSTHKLTHSHTHTLTQQHSQTHTRTNTHTHSHTHTLTHSHLHTHANSHTAHSPCSLHSDQNLLKSSLLSNAVRNSDPSPSSSSPILQLANAVTRTRLMSIGLST